MRLRQEPQSCPAQGLHDDSMHGPCMNLQNFSSGGRLHCAARSKLMNWTNDFWS